MATGQADFTEQTTITTDAIIGGYQLKFTNIWLAGVTITSPVSGYGLELRNPTDSTVRGWLVCQGVIGGVLGGPDIRSIWPFATRIFVSTAADDTQLSIAEFEPNSGHPRALFAYSGIQQSYLRTFTLSANLNHNGTLTYPSTITGAAGFTLTGTAHRIILPAWTPGAAASGAIDLQGLFIQQGAITNPGSAIADALTIKQLVITGAAGQVNVTGVYTWTGITITTPAQAANSANNAGIAIKITGGAVAGGASAYQRGLDITMAASTDRAINVVTGLSVVNGLAALFGGSNLMTFTKAADVAARTITFPDVTDTVAVLGTAQTFSAAKTFSALSNIFTNATVGSNVFFQMQATGAGFGGAGNIQGFNWYDGTNVNAAIGASYNSALGLTEIIFHSLWLGGYNTNRLFSFRSTGHILIGLAGTTAGSIGLSGVTSGVVTMAVAAAAGTWTMTLPTGVAGTGGFQLTDAAGDGVCSWSGAGSRREWKNPLGLEYSVSPSQALDRILGTMIYPFRFKKGFGTGDYETIYQGLYADEAPWAMHFEGGILNPISTFGHTVLAIQALNAKIDRLEAELSKYKEVTAR